MIILKSLFNWLVGIPAAGIDYLIASVLGIAALAAPVLAWHWVIKFLEPESLGANDFPGKPRKFSTGIIAAIAGLYVFAVAGEALFHLPRILFAIMNAAD